MANSTIRGRSFIEKREIYIYPKSVSTVFPNFDEALGPLSAVEAKRLEKFLRDSDPTIKLLIIKQSPTPQKVPQLRPVYVGARKDLEIFV